MLITGSEVLMKIKKEKMEMAKAQQQMEMQKMFAGAAANAVGGAAQQDLLNTGGANIPPELSQQAMQMLGGLNDG